MKWLALKVSLHQNRFFTWKLEAMGSYPDGAFFFLFHSKVEQNDIELCSGDFINPVYDAQMKFLSRTEKSYDRSLKFLISWRLQFPKRLNVFSAKFNFRTYHFRIRDFDCYFLFSGLSAKEFWKLFSENWTEVVLQALHLTDHFKTDNRDRCRNLNSLRLLLLL